MSAACTYCYFSYTCNILSQATVAMLGNVVGQLAVFGNPAMFSPAITFPSKVVAIYFVYVFYQSVASIHSTYLLIFALYLNIPYIRVLSLDLTLNNSWT